MKFSNSEPIAIIGMACRFPGSKDLSGFWKQLIAGGNAVTEGPPGAVIGRTGRQFPQFKAKNEAIRFGAFVEDLDLFDAEFFRISPMEAQMLDPQQRMMLEVSWRALEDATIRPDELRHSRTGVYAGISIMDYRDMAINDPATAEAAAGLYAVTGNALNTAIGRVSFVLGLEGPSMAIDTACSSSLVAIHQAAGALQRHEADLALAGGVHATFAGRPLELRANAGMLSPTGQCWTFDAAADGFVSGEGCGLIVLKRLSEAQADGDRIWAIVAGSSVTQDGASPGLTVPSATSQEKAMEEALARAGVSPSDIDYLEAHGTGTVVGDPIELSAAAAVYGRGRSTEQPLLVGSVKTNIGHLGPAAGVAGLIKTVLAMWHGIIPRHLNFTHPNPRIDWNSLPVRVADASTDWPLRAARPPMAGINSFGWSGTNGHVLVQGYTQPNSHPDLTRSSLPAGPAHPVRTHPGQVPAPAARDTRLLPLSARSPEALRETGQLYLDWLDHRIEDLGPESVAAGPALSDMAWTAAVGRSHFTHRAGLVFGDAAGLRHQLKQLTEGDRLGARQAPREANRLAFVFTGQASQWPGMGETLYDREPVFQSVLDRCDRLLMEERGVSLLAVMFDKSGEGGLLDEPAWTQPAIYSLECALVALWEGIGVRPDVVVGHSLGEIAAAQVAGGFTLEEGLRYAAARGALMGATRGDGAMAAVFAPAADVASAVADHNKVSEDEELTVAVDNGPQQVISGPAAELEKVLAQFEAARVKVARLRKSPAYHSALVEPALDELEEALSKIAPNPPALAVPLVSNISGCVLESEARMDAAYWRRHAREPVSFRRCVETLAEMEVDVVVEIGPHAVLGPVVSMNWPEAAPAGPPTVLASLRRPPRNSADPAADASGGFLDAAAGAWETGLDLEFAGLFSGEERRRVALPGYPFQRVQHWVRTSKRRYMDEGHPLLGCRHESPRGEIMFETELFPSDPAWLLDHLVYERVVAPGGLYGAMAVSVALNLGKGPAVVDEMQIYSPLMFDAECSGGEENAAGRTVQFVLDGPEDSQGRRFEIYTREQGGQAWTLHAGGRLSVGAQDLEPPPPSDPDALKDELAPQDPGEFYRMRNETGIYLGPSYHTFESAWAREGESLSVLALHDSVDSTGMEMHPLLLDGCFQALSMARHLTVSEQGAVYMPFGWERLWVAGPMPRRMLCHATIRTSSTAGSEGKTDGPPEVVTGDVRFYSAEGDPLGGLFGFTVKRATRGALLSAGSEVKDLLYEVAWREKPSGGTLLAADCLASPASISRQSRTLADWLAEEGVEAADRVTLLQDLERLSCAYALAALERLGWQRRAGEEISPEDLRHRLKIVDAHRRLFGRLLDMLADEGILSRSDSGFSVAYGVGETLPDGSLADPGRLAGTLGGKHPQGANEIGLLSRCGDSLAAVLQGRTDPLPLLFGDEGTGAADLYLKAPAAHAANLMLGDAIAAAISGMPEHRRVRVLEVGAGTGSATLAILPRLPQDRCDYTFTDISAGFFSKAEGRLSAAGVAVEFKVLDIEVEPAAQGFADHAYDLVVAANVLHATRDLAETLAHCRDLLAPSGQLIALEGLQRRSWQDLTFGLLDGWWRFADRYRPDHALAAPAAWRRALGDAGFSDVEFLGTADPDADPPIGSSIILARGPAEVALPAGAWVIASDQAGTGAELATELAARNQTVVLVHDESASCDALPEESGIRSIGIDPDDREAWRVLLEGLPAHPPLRGVVHLMALCGHGASATTDAMAEDAFRAGATALALAQGLIDAGLTPADGVGFVTRGAQVLEKDRLDRTSGELAGATLWGFGKAMSREAAHLQPRMIDLDPGPEGTPASVLALELLSPDPETHIALRGSARYAARLVRMAANDSRLSLPGEPDWVLSPGNPGDGLESLHARPTPKRPLEPGEVRIAVEAMGLNFVDTLTAMGALAVQGEIGREMAGRVLETAQGVDGLSVGDRVVGMGFGAFAPEMIAKASLVVPAPAGFSPTALATLPLCFVTAEIAFDIAELKAGERVLVHAGAGGVGLAAIQMAQSAGAEVFATASSAKQDWLRSLGVEQVFDSRQTRFGDEILKVTKGEGVQVVLNSLTGAGFIEASLSCLGSGGRFIELGKRDIWSAEEVSALRPDAAYAVLGVDALKRIDPERVGPSLSRIMARLAAGELTPLPHTVWPLAEIRSAMDAMRSGRHTGKNVLRMPPLARGGLRPDRSYLITGGLGGIGCAVADWLAGYGAGAIVLNGRRNPDPEAEEVIRRLREDGMDVQVEIADVTDFAAVDGLLARIDAGPKPLGGVIHSVGVLSDGVIENQSWERFEQVLWPKVLGAWHLHQATRHRDLDLFVLFSSVTGVIGNPGQSNHAAANAFLDQLAGHRRVLGLPGQAIAWGAWSEIGEAEEQRERIEQRRAALGGRWFTPQQGIKAFENLVRQDATTSVVMAMDWAVFEEAAGTRPPLLEDMLPVASDLETEAPAPSGDLLFQLRGAPAAAHEELLVSFLQQEVQAVLRLPTTPAPTVGFFDLGMDSLMAVELRNRLNRAFSEEYTASNTVVFDYPDIATLAGHLAEELGDVDGVPAPQAQPGPEPRHRPTERREDDGIAIVGMACRFPGAPDLPSFWRVLEAGEDMVTDGRPDADFWADLDEDFVARYAAYCRGGFVEGLDKFDARFFGIRPIEARAMDPRQRLLLETSWQALEDAGMDPDLLKGSQTGVYVGLGGSEYRDLVMGLGEEDNYIGTTGSVAAGRISYALGFMGPAIPLDMTCASSLAAVHQAAASLRCGEVDLALAGGVNTILSPAATKFMADFGLLSASGRCRAFDAAADGFVRGEGCGIVVLKRVGKAEADGDRIWGVIRGSAINQNGASAGISAPSGTAQEQVLGEALAQAGIPPSEVDYLEAHGTGSELGDPIEVRAAAAVYGKGREADRPLLIGSVKPNIGHLEWAAGVSALIKVVLAMQRGKIPRQLHLKNPSPQVDWDQLPVRVTSETIDWPLDPGRPPRAGVSAFGLSGTNAHVIVEGYGAPQSGPSKSNGMSAPKGAEQTVDIPLPESVADLLPAAGEFDPRAARILPLSGKSHAALGELAGEYRSWLDDHAEEFSEEGEALGRLLADMAWTAGMGRSHFTHRAGVVFSDAESLRDGLEALAEADERSEPRVAAKAAFVYTGQDSQWVGMGEALYRSEPVIRAVLDQCDAWLQEEREASLLDVMFGRAGSKESLDDPAWAQPAIYALECALTAWWQSMGVRPSAVIGHDLGEIAAAQAAGVLGLEDGLRFAASRGALVEAPDELEAAFSDIATAPPSITLVSSTMGRTVGPDEVLDATYWREQACKPVELQKCVGALSDFGIDGLVEIGPREAFGPMLASTWLESAGDAGEPALIPSLSEPSGDEAVEDIYRKFVGAVAKAYEAGLPVSFQGLFAGEARRRISLPGYPFQRRHHWIKTSKQ